ncbi:MAG TPA: ATP-binding protein [Longimicrobiaceae bacterium]|nr:ATP-binding protein [Longimicrobiaceae bacterium]
MDERLDPQPEANGQTDGKFTPRSISDRTRAAFDGVAAEKGGAYVPLPIAEGAVGWTHFDTASSEDNSVVVLLARENMDRLPLQTLVRIRSLKDDNSLDRTFLGVVVAGPFAEPDGLRTESPIIVATTVQGRIFLPRYHGRAHVQVLGEEADGQLLPPRRRPRPNSPVFVLEDDETRAVLQVAGTVRLGTVVGQEEIEVAIPTGRKSVLPRHLAIIGTTGSGKSTTTSGVIHQFQGAGVATVLFDVEGEYTEMDLPTDDDAMRAALERRGREPEGTRHLCIYHLVGHGTSREAPGGRVRAFSLRFEDLSPHAVAEILELNEAQTERFHLAYDAGRHVLRDLGIYPSNDEEKREALAYDELETGSPGMTLSFVIDIVDAVIHCVSGAGNEFEPFNDFLRSEQARGIVQGHAGQASKQVAKSPSSWKAVRSRLGSIHRFRVFDNPAAEPLDCNLLIRPDRVSVVDLSDTDSPRLNNLVIASVLRGIQQAQEDAVAEAQRRGEHPTPVEVVIEEAHEFLSRERIAQMGTLFQQVARIAKRGRKRWLGLVFVTQLPQHLPDEVLGLVNNFVIHKIGDANVVDRLRRVIPGLDRSQWEMVPALAPGQAVVSLTSLTRPLLVAVDPAPCRLRMAGE